MLCGGLGTRLRPVTESVPKAMAAVGRAFADSGAPAMMAVAPVAGTRHRAVVEVRDGRAEALRGSPS